ncbi:outer membrane beta-barrel protein [Winogradskyella sp.]|jgi:opacity protein-like surface antigen|uniref:outer membrane beta-barrel protein n=1 Tax=Winogradskyella sp. TaxID=1883156 RepID=UPI0025EB7216|nr:outer membrane beta-barrel protein [Winogradskyella sp.]MCT4630400.1 PorT family protein [Winogradskyella sp.]
MKNLSQILSVILILCLVTDIANSQTLKVTGGVNLMSIDTALESSNDGDPNDDPNDDPADLPARASIINGKTSNNQASFVSKNGTTNETGFYLGLALSDISLFNNFELQPEVRFVAVKDFNQIQVPVLLSYNITEEFHALAGPNLAFLLDTGDGVKSFNFALDFGLSYDVSDKIALDARYDWGLTNLLEDGDSDNYIKINNIQLGVVYRFGK